MSKGSSRRPARVEQLEFDANWEKTFGHRIRFEGDECRTCDGTKMVGIPIAGTEYCFTQDCPDCTPKF